jgi:ubiquinone/menaquinone biosynthesis C-methylase UbiE
VRGAHDRQAAVTTHFDSYAVRNRWGDLYNPDNPQSYSFLARRRKAVELLGNLDGKKLLDLGCGTGALVEPLLSTGVEYEGIDIAPTMIAVAQNHLQELGAETRFKVRVGTGASLPYGANQFDAVVAMGFLEYFDEPERMIAEVIRVAKPGARLVFTIPQKFCLDAWVVRATAPVRSVARVMLRKPPEPVERNKYTPRQFQELFQKFGCRIVGERFYNTLLLPYPITRFFPALANAAARLGEERPQFRFFATGYVLACEK